MLEIRTLGTLDLVGVHGEQVAPVLSQPKRLALLVYLAAARPYGFHRRDTLLPLFWPDFDEKRARSALRNSLYFLRRSLGQAVLINRGDTDVGVDRNHLCHDVGAFEDAVRRGDVASALDVYRGNFLPGFHLVGCPDFERWVDGERARLRQAAASAAWGQAARLVDAGGLTVAERVARRALCLSPADESAARSFMESLAQAGDRAAALRFYTELTARLKEEVEVEPSTLTRAVAHRIREDDHGEAGSRPSEGSTPGLHIGGDPRPSVAVLPFESFTEEAGMEYFGLGVMDDVLTRLSRVLGLRVVSRQSTRRYRADDRSTPEIARELGVQAVLEGSVRRCGERVRVVAQLIDGVSDDHLWAESYERDLGDLFRVQTDIAERIARALSIELSDEERVWIREVPTDDLEAWKLYVRAVQAYQDLGPRELEEAREHLLEAVHRDSTFAQAWALMAQVLVLRGFCAAEHPGRLFPEIRYAAKRALELNPRCGEAHAALGVVKLFHEWSPREADEAFSRALKLNPDDTLSLGWKAIFLALAGRGEEAVSAARHTVAADPLSAAAHLVLGQVLIMAGRPEESLAVLEAGVGRWPRALQLRAWLGLAQVYCGRPQAALAHYEVARDLSGHLPHVEALRATALVALGRKREAQATLKELKVRSEGEYVDPYSLFSLTLVLAGPDAAAPYLQDMLEARSIFLPYLRGMPRFKALREDPRLRAALQRVWPVAVSRT